jgi:hypothetical protein
MGWACKSGRERETRNVYIILVSKLLVKLSVSRITRNLENNIKIELRKMGLSKKKK